MARAANPASEKRVRRPSATFMQIYGIVLAVHVFQTSFVIKYNAFFAGPVPIPVVKLRRPEILERIASKVPRVLVPVALYWCSSR